MLWLIVGSINQLLFVLKELLERVLAESEKRRFVFGIVVYLCVCVENPSKIYRAWTLFIYQTFYECRL